MELAEVMRTTPATRTFTDDTVPDEVLHRILDHARFAPSGGNRQGWHVVVVKDAGIRTRLRELYQASLREYWAHRSDEHTSEPQSLMRHSYAVFCLKNNKATTQQPIHYTNDFPS